MLLTRAAEFDEERLSDMDAATYAIESEIEATHWWFVERRKLFCAEIARLEISRDARVLDIGTSTGTNLRMLHDSGFKNVLGLDPSEEAIRFCADKGFGEVIKGDAQDLPFQTEAFDLVLATDVIEHLDNDGRAVAEIERVLKPGGWVIITVPTFQSLWGLQDEVSQHKRRYRKGEVLNLVSRARLDVNRHYYFNFILFFPIWLARQVIRISGMKLKSENEMNSPLANAVLRQVFRCDCSLAPLVKPPFGVSALVVAQKARVARAAVR